jgi:prolipoprotein diacylglyceryltransferase
MILSIVGRPELHPVFEALGYAAGYAVYKWLRGRAGDALTEERRWLLLAAAALGALAGSRVLGLLEHVPQTGFHWQRLLLPGGKTIVGGLLGGWAAVELTKLALGVKRRTGDLYAIPLCVGIAVGRVGCFIAGLADDTYGKPTKLPWGVDFGDGVARHPTQLYEIGFLVALAGVLWWLGRRPHREGTLFRVFMGSYLAWRVAIDFLKPQPLVAGLNGIQWACLVGLVAIAIGALTGARSVDTRALGEDRA